MLLFDWRELVDLGARDSEVGQIIAVVIYLVVLSELSELVEGLSKGLSAVVVPMVVTNS